MFLLGEEDRVSPHSPGCTGSHCIDPSYVQTQRSNCLCVPSTGFKGVYHHTWPSTRKFKTMCGFHLWLPMSLLLLLWPVPFAFWLEQKITLRDLEAVGIQGRRSHFNCFKKNKRSRGPKLKDRETRRKGERSCTKFHTLGAVFLQDPFLWLHPHRPCGFY